MARKWKLKSAWYRPQSLAALGRLTDDQVRAQEDAYVDWLAEARKMTLAKADNYARNQSVCGLISTARHQPSKIREETAISDRVTIRTVRCFSSGRQDHYGWNPSRYHPYKPVLGWQRLPKVDAPTHYNVMVDGRRVDSFLTRSRARACAEKLAAQHGNSVADPYAELRRELAA